LNLPNKLTLLRMILVPAVVVFILYDFMPHRWLVAGLLFGVAAITDAFDGRIARSRGLITDFGKLMDPVADKMLVIAVLVAFVPLGLCSPWIVIIVLLREFLVTSIRMVSSAKGIVIPANNWGKAKTVTQMTALGVIFAIQYALWLLPELGVALPAAVTTWLPVVGHVLLWISTAATVISGATYVADSKELFKDA